MTSSPSGLGKKARQRAKKRYQIEVQQQNQQRSDTDANNNKKCAKLKVIGSQTERLYDQMFMQIGDS